MAEKQDAVEKEKEADAPKETSTREDPVRTREAG